MPRWVAALRIARREAGRARARAGFTVALIALPVAAVTFIAGLLASTTPTTATQIQWSMGEQAQARVWAPSPTVPEDLQQDATGEQVDYGDPTDEVVDAESIEKLRPGEVHAAYQLRTAALSNTGLVPRLGFYEVDAARIPGLLGEVEGEPAPGPGEVVLLEQVAERLGVSPGDRIDLSAMEGFAVEVVGIGSTPSADAVGLLGPGTLAAAGIVDGADTGVPEPGSPGRLWFITGEPVGWAEVEALNDEGFVVMSRALLADPPPPADVYDGAFADSGADLTMIGFLVAVLGIGLLEVALLVGPAFAIGAKRSAHTLALVAAAGGSARDLRRIVLASGTFAGCLAAIAGTLTGAAALLVWFVVASRTVNPPPNLVIPLPWALGAAVFALGLGMAAAWIPANQAARTDVVVVLSGRRAETVRRRSTPWLGLAIASAGVATALVAAATRSPTLLAAGGVAALLGAVIASSVFVDLAGKFAPRTGFATRFALRDAARHRTRTAPALAAVLAAVAVATGGLIVITTEEHAEAASWAPFAAQGTGLIYNFADTDFDAILPAATEVIEHRLPTAEVTAVRLLDGTNSAKWWHIVPVDNPDHEEESGGAVEASHGMTGLMWGAGGAVIDDGTMVSRTGLSGAKEAAEALAEGEVLVSSPAVLWPGNTVRISVDDGTGGPGGEPITALAHLVEWGHPEYTLVVPPQVADTLVAATRGEDGEQELGVHTVGALVTGAGIDQQVQDELNRELAEIADPLTLEVEGRMLSGNSGPGAAALIVTATLAVALLATLLSIGLAMAESRADLATATAVGADPSIRRRIVAAQAGVIAVLGTGCGIAAGFMLGYVLANWQSVSYGPHWHLAVPWVSIIGLAVGIPLLAITAGWLFAPSRLPLRNRAAM